MWQPNKSDAGRFSGKFFAVVDWWRFFKVHFYFRSRSRFKISQKSESKSPKRGEFLRKERREEERAVKAPCLMVMGRFVNTLGMPLLPGNCRSLKAELGGILTRHLWNTFLTNESRLLLTRPLIPKQADVLKSQTRLEKLRTQPRRSHSLLH